MSEKNDRIRKCNACIHIKDCEYKDTEKADKCEEYQSYFSKEKPIGELIVDFAMLRDTLSDERKVFKQREKDLKDEMEKIEVKILKKQKELGVKSVSVEKYTAYQSEKRSIRIGDWDKFIKWVINTKNTQCLEKRCAKLACIEIEEEITSQQEETEEKFSLDKIGLDDFSEICVLVRKK